MKSPFLATFFQTTPPPPEAMGGYYNFYIVALSLFVAILASYVALSIASYIRHGITKTLFWSLIGGAFAMGAGIFTMHFVGMLAFIMPMKMGYDLTLTLLSLLVAITASYLALYIVRTKEISWERLLLGGVIIGCGIAGMHYTGMEAMLGVTVTYLPSLFFLSLLIAITAAVASLWLMVECDKKKGARRTFFKIGSAMVMGGAICGVHYVGISATVFVPASHTQPIPEFLVLSPLKMALLISYVAILIMIVGLYIIGRQYSIFFKLFFGYLIIVFMMLPIAFASIDNIKALTEAFSTINNQAFPRIVALLEMKSLSAKIGEIASSLSHETSPPVWEQKEKAIAITLDKFEEFEKKYNSTASAAEHADTSYLHGLKNSITQAASNLMYAPKKNLSQAEISNLKSILNRTSDELDHFIELQTQMENKQLAQLEMNALALRNHLFTVTVSVIGVIVLLALFLSLLTSFKISKPIIELRDTLREITKGKLEGQRVRVPSEDEIGQLSMDFNMMVGALEASNKKRDEFVGMAAHDLRIPASVISEGSNLLVAGAVGELNKKQHRLAEMIAKASQSMVSLLDELLSVNRGGVIAIQIHIKKINLVDFLENIFSFNQLLAEKKHIELKMQNETGEESAFFDESKIAQVINNFVSNALKFSPCNAVVNLIVKKIGKNLRVEVQDQAGGIPEAEQKMVFTWFAKISVKPTAGEASHGLGLAICKDIINAHGGDIGFVSQWGKGSTFFFEIAAFKNG